MTAIIRFSDLVALGVVRSPATLHRWMKSGKFPQGTHLQDGGHRVWTADEVNEWLAARGIPTELAKTDAT